MRKSEQQYYKRQYKPQHPEKYHGNHSPFMRSSWEYAFAKWLDYNHSVEWWASESTVIPYRSKLDNRWHRYYIDFTVKFTNGKIVLFEIKPKEQTIAPKQPKRRTKRFLTEVKMYTQNVSKWEAARAYAQARGVSFQILTQQELKKLGLKII